ncbi:unnamed protein product, partial [marine sediment metagenome]
GQDEGVGELTYEVATEGSTEQSWRVAQNSLISLLPFPERGWRQNLPHPSKDDEDEVAKEAQPDDPSCLTITIDLGKNITEDIAQWENDYGCRQDKGAEAYHLYGNNIGSD